MLKIHVATHFAPFFVYYDRITTLTTFMLHYLFCMIFCFISTFLPKISYLYLSQENVERFVKKNLKGIENLDILLKS